MAVRIFPSANFCRSWIENPVALNVLTFVGHATLRRKAMGDNTNRPATREEIEKMRDDGSRGYERRAVSDYRLAWNTKPESRQRRRRSLR